MRVYRDYEDVPETDSSKGGKFNEISEAQLAYGSMASNSDVRFFSATTVREKCENCPGEIPCCEADCSVYEDKIDMQVNECRRCIFGGEYCYTAEELTNEADYRKSIKEFTIRDRQGNEYSYEDIDSMEEGEKKLLLAFRFINKFFRYIGRENLIFRYRKNGRKYEVKFADEEYEISRDKTVPEIFDKVFGYGG